jgi:hypothetical protein
VLLPARLSDCERCTIATVLDRVHMMVDISDDTKVVRHRAEVTGMVRRRRWRDEEKGRIVAEAIAPQLEALIEGLHWTRPAAAGSCAVTCGESGAAALANRL